MLRTPLLSLSILMIALAGLMSSAAAEDLPLQLKTNVSITEDVIKVGDLWDNAGDKADLAIAVAPQPGKRVTLDVRWLTMLAQKNELDWNPQSQFDHAVVEREGQSIDIGVVETELRDALSLEGVPTTSTIEITNRQSLSIVIPADASPTIAIKDLIFDPRAQRFSAVVESPAGSPSALRVKVVGRTMSTTKIPALMRAMSRGETITAQDVVWNIVRDESLHTDMVTDPNQLIGMEPRHLIKANSPIRQADLQHPLAVTRGGLVTMILQTPFMTLTSQGIAMEDGGIGETVRVTNQQTKQIVEARVQSQGSVIVAAAPVMIPAPNSKSVTAAAN